MICSWICNISRAPARPSHSHAAFVPSSIQFTIHLWKFVEDYHTTFVLGIILHSLPLLYHLRSAKIFQPPTYQLIPKFPSFPRIPNFPSFPRIPNFPSFPRIPAFPSFPRFPAFPCFPCFPRRPKSSTHPRHPSKIFCPFVLLSFFSFCPSV